MLHRSAGFLQYAVDLDDEVLHTFSPSPDLASTAIYTRHKENRPAPGQVPVKEQGLQPVAIVT